MNRPKLIKHLVFLMFFVFLLNLLGKQFYWYFTIWYFDMIMHFLGGLWEGLFFIWFFTIQGLPAPVWLKDFRGSRLIYKAILFVLFIGISWEFFEIFTNNYIGRDPFNTLDTISDVFFDLSGGFTAIFYFLKRIMPTAENGVQ